MFTFITLSSRKNQISNRNVLSGTCCASEMLHYDTWWLYTTNRYNSVYILYKIDFYLVTDRYCLQILQTSSAVYRARLSEGNSGRKPYEYLWNFVLHLLSVLKFNLNFNQVFIILKKIENHFQICKYQSESDKVQSLSLQGLPLGSPCARNQHIQISHDRQSIRIRRVALSLLKCFIFSMLVKRKWSVMLYFQIDFSIISSLNSHIETHLTPNWQIFYKYIS